MTNKTNIKNSNQKKKEREKKQMFKVHKIVS